MAIFFIVLGVILRIAPYVPALSFIPHLPNFSPIAAMALFSGVYLSKKYALILPVLAMLLGDFVIGFYQIPIMASVYLSFVLIGLIGIYIRKRKSATNVAAAAIFGSIAFFLITNFAVWAVPGSFYPHNWQGLVQCYIMGLPFFRNSLLGDIFYTGVFFGGYELVSYAIKRRGFAKLKRVE